MYIINNPKYELRYFENQEHPMLQKSTLLTNTDAPKASKEHKQFHKLLEKIELLKKMIEEKKQLASKFNQQKNEHVLPLVIQLCAVKISQIRALDWAYDRTKFSKRIRARLAEEILTRINELFHSFQVDETQEKELMVIFARHTGADVEEL